MADWRDRVRTRPHLALISTSAVALAVALTLLAVSAEIYDNVAENDGIAGIDQPVLDQMVAWRSPGLTSGVGHFTDLGSPAILPVLAVAAAAALSWWWRSWTPALLLLIASVGSLTMSLVGKAIVGRARPGSAFEIAPFETSPSFPSGHTINTWVISLMVAYLVTCKIRRLSIQILAFVVATFFGIAMGLSRVYLGHHWMTDVLVAWTLGTAWVTVVIVAHRFVREVTHDYDESAT